jgi:acyl-CoA thioesterase-1
MGLKSMIQARLREIAWVMTMGALLLAGCKSSTDNERSLAASGNGPIPMQTPQTAAGPETTPHDSRPVVACFGDSLTAGYGVDADNSYPAELQRALDAAGYAYRVVNMGISGETTKDGLARVERVIRMHPEVVVVEFGGNDGLRGVPVASSRENLDAIVDQLKKSGTRVALAGITLPPQYSSPYIKSFNETYTVLAKKYAVPLLPFVLKDVYGVPGSIQQDGIHPTAQGCIQVAKNVLRLIEPLLRK